MRRRLRTGCCFLTALVSGFVLTGCQQEAVQETKPEVVQSKISSEEKAEMSERLKNWDPKKDKK